MFDNGFTVSKVSSYKKTNIRILLIVKGGGDWMTVGQEVKHPGQKSLKNMKGWKS